MTKQEQRLARFREVTRLGRKAPGKVSIIYAIWTTACGIQMSSPQRGIQHKVASTIKKSLNPCGRAFFNYVIV